MAPLCITNEMRGEREKEVAAPHPRKEIMTPAELCPSPPNIAGVRCAGEQNHIGKRRKAVHESPRETNCTSLKCLHISIYIVLAHCTLLLCTNGMLLASVLSH